MRIKRYILPAVEPGSAAIMGGSPRSLRPLGASLSRRLSPPHDSITAGSFRRRRRRADDPLHPHRGTCHVRAAPIARTSAGGKRRSPVARRCRIGANRAVVAVRLYRRPGSRPCSGACRLGGQRVVRSSRSGTGRRQRSAAGTAAHRDLRQPDRQRQARSRGLGCRRRSAGFVGTPAAGRRLSAARAEGRTSAEHRDQHPG